MEVFISWSGERSGKVAEALRDWLPSVIQSVDPFISSTDIEKGSRWLQDLTDHLEEAQFGLICLTQDNLEAPWLLFEAGALSKSIQNSRVVPYLYGVSPTSLQWPLAQFQAAAADKSSTLEVIHSINAAYGENALERSRLEVAFETWWPQLETKLNNIPQTAQEAPPPRADRDILEEILRLCRQISRQSSPSLESEQEILRNLVAHGLHSEHGDSSEGLNAEYIQSNVEAERRRRIVDRMRSNRERHRRLLEERSHERPTSERDARSGYDVDNEAQT